MYAFGHIGAAVARVGNAFGMHVVCWGRAGSSARAQAEGFEIAASRVTYQMHSYPGTRHGFHNNSTPRYNEAAAKLAWERTMAFFKQHLG